MTAKSNKQILSLIDKFRLPSGQCQACLSDKSYDVKDFMITCQLCQSSIHNKHYGRQIDEANIPPYEQWMCQRCRFLSNLIDKKKIGEIEVMKCRFCPDQRGILKRVYYNGSQIIWLHPECSTWTYPIISSKNTKRLHYNIEMPLKQAAKFWVNLDDEPTTCCSICNQAYGYKIKCNYYSCHKYYHCTCAKMVGFIRDLQSMRLQNSDTYIPPYCQQHLLKRVEDCKQKAKKYKNLKDQFKANTFSQMKGGYQVQLQNMRSSAKKFKQLEDIRQQIEKTSGEASNFLEQLSFQNSQISKSQHSDSFYNYIFDNFIDNNLEKMIDSSEQEVKMEEQLPIQEQRDPELKVVLKRFDPQQIQKDEISIEIKEKKPSQQLLIKPLKKLDQSSSHEQWRDNSHELSEEQI